MFLLFIKYLVLIVVTIVPLIIAVAFFTLAERKIMGGIQRRRGPNVVGLWGLLQPFADALKLIFKEIIIPRKSNKLLFLIAPMLTLFLSLTGWCIMPYSYNSAVINTPLNIIFFFTITGLGIYGVLIAGWSSNSKYALIGSIRSVAQMISYEISFGLIIITLVLCCGTLNLQDFVYWQGEGVWFCIPFLPLAIIFFICILAETNRAPFDLPEAEAEIVAGYNIDYSSITFALFFLGEYSSMLLMSSFYIIIFWGGWLSPLLNTPSIFWFSLKLSIMCFLFILVRASFPRYRYDQLMDIGWKVFIPITLSYVFIVSFLLVIFNGLPFYAF